MCERTVCSEMNRRSAVIVGAEVLVEQEQHLQLACRARCSAIDWGTTPCCRPPSRTWSSSRRATAPEQPAASPLATPCRNSTIRSGWLVLQQVAGGAESDRREQVRVVLGRLLVPHYDDSCLWGRFPHLRESGEAVHLGHRQVEDDEVGPKLAGVRTIASAPPSASVDHLEAVRGEAPTASASRVSGWSSAISTRVVMTAADSADTRNQRAMAHANTPSRRSSRARWCSSRCSAPRWRCS